MHRAFRLRSLLITISCTLPSVALANFQSDMLNSKRAKPALDSSAHWNLADWLSQKSKVRLMDQWLAMHRGQRWAEVLVSGASGSFKKTIDTAAVTVATDQTLQNYRADLYFWVINLNGEFEKTNDDHEAYAGAAGLRLLGSNARTTSLVLRYGRRHLEDFLLHEYWSNDYAEAMLQLYILRFFGVNSEYRQYVAAVSNLDRQWSGHRYSGGVFFEFLAFRIFGYYFEEPSQLSQTVQLSAQTNRGFAGGLSLHF